jgi:hypothetical protein
MKCSFHNTVIPPSLSNNKRNVLSELTNSALLAFSFISLLPCKPSSPIIVGGDISTLIKSSLDSSSSSSFDDDLFNSNFYKSYVEYVFSTVTNVQIFIQTLFTIAYSIEVFKKNEEKAKNKKISNSEGEDENYEDENLILGGGNDNDAEKAESEVYTPFFNEESILFTWRFIFNYCLFFFFFFTFYVCCIFLIFVVLFIIFPQYFH